MKVLGSSSRTKEGKEKRKEKERSKDVYSKRKERGEGAYRILPRPQRQESVR